MRGAVDQVGGAVDVFHAVLRQVGAHAQGDGLLQACFQPVKAVHRMALGAVEQLHEQVQDVLVAHRGLGQQPVDGLLGDREALAVQGGIACCVAQDEGGQRGGGVVVEGFLVLPGPPDGAGVIVVGRDGAGPLPVGLVEVLAAVQVAQDALHHGVTGGRVHVKEDGGGRLRCQRGGRGVPVVRLQCVAEAAVLILVGGQCGQDALDAAALKAVLPECQLHRTGAAVHEGAGFFVGVHDGFPPLPLQHNTGGGACLVKMRHRCANSMASRGVIR